MIRALTAAAIAALASVAGATDVSASTTSTTTTTTDATAATGSSASSGSSFLVMPLDVTSFKSQIEAYHSGFNQTIMVNEQPCYRNLWGNVVCPSASTTASAATTTSTATTDAAASGRRALHDGGRRRYVNANFNDIKGSCNEGFLTQYKGLTFFPFMYFDVSDVPRDIHIPSEMRGKAAGFTVVGSITVTDPEKVFTPVSFDISSPSVDKDGYLYSIVVGFQYNTISLIEDVLEAFYRSTPYYNNIQGGFGAGQEQLAKHKDGDTTNGDSSSNGDGFPIFLPNINIPPQLEAYFPSMIQGFTLRGNKAKRVYLDGFDDVKQLFIVNIFGRGVSVPPVMVMDNLVYTEMEEAHQPTFSPIAFPPWGFPTVAPTDSPTDAPTDSPTDAPTDSPTDAPTDGATVVSDTILP